MILPYRLVPVPNFTPPDVFYTDLIVYVESLLPTDYADFHHFQVYGNRSKKYICVEVPEDIKFISTDLKIYPFNVDFRPRLSMGKCRFYCENFKMMYC